MNKPLDIDRINALLADTSEHMLTDAQLGYAHKAGSPMPAAQRAAIGKANRGVTRTMPAWTEERKAAHRALALQRSADRQARRAAGEVVSVYSDEARRNIGLAATGRKHSEESRLLRSESMKRTLALSARPSNRSSRGHGRRSLPQLRPRRTSVTNENLAHAPSG